MLKQLKTESHNVRCRQAMKMAYHADIRTSRAKTGIKYYKSLYREDEYAMEILMNGDLHPCEKLKQIKKYHFDKKIEGI